MCRRLIINAGINRVVARVTDDEYNVTLVREWIFNDDTLHGVL
jgi:dCMP deaminase